MLCAVALAALLLGGCDEDVEIVRPYDLPLDEYVDVGEYIGRPYTPIEIAVTEQEVDDEVEAALQAHADRKEIPDGVIQKGDYVRVSYTLMTDEEPQRVRSEQTVTLQVGEGQLPKELESSLVDHAVGDTFDVRMTFPEDYTITAALAGKSAVFTVTIDMMYDVKLPTLDDAFAMRYLGCETVETYRENVRQRLYEEKETAARYEEGGEIWDAVLEASEVLQYPEKEVLARQKSLTDSFGALCEQYGISFESALSDILQEDRASFDAEMRDSAEAQVKEEMVLYAIARENDLEMSLSEQRAYLEDALSANGLTERDFEEQYGMTIEEYAEQSGIITSRLYERVFTFLIENGVAQ